MALPNPDSALFVPNIAGLIFGEDRGSVEVFLPTKSTRNRASAYVQPDQCERDVIIRGGIAATVNQLDDCQIIQAGNISVSVSVPAVKNDRAEVTTGTEIENNVDLLWGLVRVQLINAMTAKISAVTL